MNIYQQQPQSLHFTSTPNLPQPTQPVVRETTKDTRISELQPDAKKTIRGFI